MYNIMLLVVPYHEFAQLTFKDVFLSTSSSRDYFLNIIYTYKVVKTTLYYKQTTTTSTIPRC